MLKKVRKISPAFRKKGEKIILHLVRKCSLVLENNFEQHKGVVVLTVLLWGLFLKLPKAPNPKKNRCVCISYGSLSSLWFPSPVRNEKKESQVSSFKSCFNTPRADTAHLLHLRRTSVIISGKEGMEREQGKDDHQPPEELGTAAIVLYV